jgi:hypothetical protein
MLSRPDPQVDQWYERNFHLRRVIPGSTKAEADYSILLLILKVLHELLGGQPVPEWKTICGREAARRFSEPELRTERP